MAKAASAEHIFFNSRAVLAVSVAMRFPILFWHTLPGVRNVPRPFILGAVGYGRGICQSSHVLVTAAAADLLF